MKLETQHDYKKGDVFSINPADITLIKDLSGRAEATDIDGLVKDIIKNGQLLPGIFRKDGDKLILIAGHRRYLAVVKINKENLIPGVQLLYKAIYRQCSEVEAFCITLSENLNRKDLTPMDESFNCTQLVKYGKTEQEIAALFGQSVQWVKDRLMLNEAIPELQAQVANGNVAVTVAKQLVKAGKDATKTALQTGGRITSRKASEATGAKQKATMKEVRALVESKTGNAEDIAVQEFAKELLQMIDGEDRR
jgi:ParB/RepB/Spo0J family partition protein